METKIVTVVTPNGERIQFENVNFVTVTSGDLILYNRVETENTVLTGTWFGEKTEIKTNVDLNIVAIFSEDNWAHFYKNENLSTPQ